MPGLCFSNELISRDEALHTEFAILMYNYLKNKPSDDVVIQIIKEAVEIEKQFITESLPCSLIGMNCKEMSDYIEYIADRLLLMYKIKPVYNKKNPFSWMESISIQGKTNFFERRVGEYSNLANPNSENNEINFEIEGDDF